MNPQATGLRVLLRIQEGLRARHRGRRGRLLETTLDQKKIKGEDEVTR